MTTHRLKTLALSASLAIGASGGAAQAAELDTILSNANEVHDQARQAQVRVDAITEETRDLLNDYKTVMKEVEGLRIYNAQLDRQIANLHLPLTYRGYAYDARLHIDLLRKRIANRVA